MTRIPPQTRDEMDADQQVIYDKMVAKNARIGFGPAIGYAYSAEVWRLHNESSTHLLDCTLTGPQVRIISLMTVHHWNAAYPWSAQAKTALNAGLAPDIIEAINAGEKPDFTDQTDTAIYDVARELLATGNLSETGFKAAEGALGYKRIAEIIHTIGHFTTTAMMANAVGAVPAADAPSLLKK